MISNLKDLYSYLLNDLYEIKDIHFLNDCKAQLFYSEKEQLHLGGKDSNRVLYYDTDSIIFLMKNKESYAPQLDDYLGRFTNEFIIFCYFKNKFFFVSHVLLFHTHDRPRLNIIFLINMKPLKKRKKLKNKSCDFRKWATSNAILMKVF